MEKKEILNNKPKSTHVETYLLGIYSGEISESDEMFQKLYQLLKMRCEDNNIDYNENITDLVEKIYDKILMEVMLDSGINLEFTKISAFEEEFIKHMNSVTKLPITDRLKAVDAVVYESITNPKSSIMGKAREYVESRLAELKNDLLMLTESENTYNQDELEKIESIFGPSSVSDEAKKKFKNNLEFFLSLPKFSLLFETKMKYKEEVNEIRSKFVVEDMETKYPEYINSLKTLVNHEGGDYTYYYHGAPSVSIAHQIQNEGLFMQYGEIERTAKMELSVPEIIEYRYGHDGVGRDAIVVIAVPNGENPVNENIDESKVVCGTGQGMEQGSFNPKYVIPSKYILGYIDKYSKKFVKNPAFSNQLINSTTKAI